VIRQKGKDLFASAGYGADGNNVSKFINARLLDSDPSPIEMVKT